MQFDGQKIPVQIGRLVTLRAAQDPNLVIVRVRNMADITPIVARLPSYISKIAPIPGSDCNDRYSSGGYFASPTGKNLIRAGFDVSYSKWTCVSADVPCPTFSNPLRFCRKEATNKDFSATVHVNIDIQASLIQDEVKIAATSTTDAPNLSGPLAFLGAVLGSTMGPLGAALGAIVGNEFGTDLNKQMSQSITNIINVPLPEMKDELKAIKFHPIGAEFAGTSPPYLQVVYETGPVRANTACFLKTSVLLK
jgi:hypothetical protein